MARPSYRSRTAPPATRTANRSSSTTTTVTILVSAITATMAVVGAIGAAVAPRLMDRLSDSGPHDVRIVDTVVRNPGINPEGSPPAVEITVRNRMRDLVVIPRVRVTAEDSVHIKQCASEGGINITGTYSVVLPPQMSPGQQLSVPVSQQVPRGEADRFALTFRMDSGGDSSPSWSLYRLHLSVEVDGLRTTRDAGTVLLALPDVPLFDVEGAPMFWVSTSQRTLDHMRASLPYSPERLRQVETCMRANTDAVQRFLAASGRESADFTKLRAALAQ